MSETPDAGALARIGSEQVLAAANGLAVRPRLTGLWRHPDFLKMWGGGAVSAVGWHISGVALPLTAVLALGATPGQMGLLVAADRVPPLAFGLFAGVWVDRVRRRPILIGADVGRALLLGSIPIAALLGGLFGGLLGT
ncbi:MAG TPA: hypothetical protein VG370_25690 [Chloroflexota bacterium]|nr:hypothetical protein [Chloroflexota bacterium]